MRRFWALTDALLGGSSRRAANAVAVVLVLVGLVALWQAGVFDR